jgi:hypothetical protein
MNHSFNKCSVIRHCIQAVFYYESFPETTNDQKNMKRMHICMHHHNVTGDTLSARLPSKNKILWGHPSSLELISPCSRAFTMVALTSA